MRAWRICRKAYAASTMDGSAGLHASGRWHQRGVPVVYLASHASLAALEMLVHVDPSSAPDDLVLLTVDLTKALTIERVEPVDLPKNWTQYPAPSHLQHLCTEWLNSGRSPVLQVPSAILPIESNFLLNPRHRKSVTAKVVSSQPFRFDGRLLRGLT